jgi:hypothetical protein
MRGHGLHGPGWPSFAASDGRLPDGQADPGKRAARWVQGKSRNFRASVLVRDDAVGAISALPAF